jgi:hypothetical protein
MDGDGLGNALQPTGVPYVFKIWAEGLFSKSGVGEGELYAWPIHAGLMHGTNVELFAVVRIAWTAETDAQLRLLAERGYTVARLSAIMQRSPVFLKARANALGVILRKLQRLPRNERSRLSIDRLSQNSRHSID